MTDEIQKAPQRSLLNITNIDQAISASEILSKSGLIPDKFKGRPADILVAMQWGAELGSVQPLQALNGIAVVNGTPSIYGDLGKALVMRQSDLAHFSLDTQGEGRQMEAICEIQRTKPHGKIGVRRTFSMEDAERGGLASRGPWKQYPARMLMWRAFWLAARDIYADVLSGLQGAEELEDLPHEIKAQKREPETVIDLSAKPKKLRGPAAAAVVVDEAEPVDKAADGDQEKQSADDKRARFTEAAVAKKTKAQLIAMIGDRKAELRLEPHEFVEVARNVGVDYAGGNPANLTLQDLRDIWGGLADVPMPSPKPSTDEEIPF